MAGDYFWHYRRLRLHLTGANGSTTFSDVKGHAITVNGNAQISTAQYPPLMGVASSAVFDGTGDYLTSPDSADIALRLGGLTIQGWVRFNVVNATQGLVAKRNTGSIYAPFVLYLDATGKLGVLFSTNGTSWAVSFLTAGAYLAATWYHFALVWDGVTWTLYVNGISAGSGALSGMLALNNHNLVIGAGAADGTNSLNGYLSEVDIAFGALYSGSFTPPAAPFDDFADAYAPAPAGSIYKTIFPGRYNPFNPIMVDPYAAIRNPAATLTKTGQHFYVTYQDGIGLGTISGEVFVGSTPVARRLHLFDEQSDILVEEKVSGVDGSYDFYYLPKDRNYYIVGYDKTNANNAVIASHLTPV
jgi:hypothetical protein